MLGLSCPCGSCVGEDSSAGSDNALKSSLVSANTAIRVPTFIPFDPAFSCHPNTLSASLQSDS